MIAPTAVIHPNARLGAGCVIGPYCVIGGHVTLGGRCRLHSHVVIDGHTTLGEENEIFPFASIGLKTQDLKWKGGLTRTQIGSHNTFREYVTITARPATAKSRPSVRTIISWPTAILRTTSRWGITLSCPTWRRWAGISR